MLREVRARGWALADDELAPGIRSVAVPVRDGSGAVRAAMNVTVHSAETSVRTLLERHLPPLREAASAVSADWAAWQARPQDEAGDAGWDTGPVSDLTQAPTLERSPQVVGRLCRPSRAPGRVGRSQIDYRQVTPFATPRPPPRTVREGAPPCPMLPLQEP